MKKCLVIALMCSILMMFSVSVSAATFTDVKSTAWYSDAVNYCYEKGYMKGIGDNSFGPDMNITRGTIVEVLYRNSGETYEQEDATAAFSDIDAGDWYYMACMWSADKGIASGYPDGTFCPDKAVTRQEMMTFIVRYIDKMSVGNALTADTRIMDSFPDAGSVGEWAEDSVAKCTSVALICGYGSYLAPTGTGTRAQLAEILKRIDRYALNDLGNITVTGSGSGTVSPSGSFTLLTGVAVTFNFVADACNRVGTITVDGVQQDYATSMAFKTSATDKTVSVTFKAVSGNYTSGMAQLVNRTYTIANAASYSPSDLVAVSSSSSIKLRQEATTALNAMLKAFKADYSGYTLYAVSGYRTNSYQQGLYNRQISKQGGNIYKAGTISAVPGSSEHELGLAVDLTNDGNLEQYFGSTVQGKWLANHCAEYGFILRYPEDKETIVGIIYEPWHFRYVGVDVATEMQEMGVTTLEEYYGLYLDDEDITPYLPYLN